MLPHPGGDSGRSWRALPWWWALIGGAAVAVSTSITILVLLSIAGRSAALRIDAIKVGLSVGAGVGAATALLLAFRRQWLGELAQIHAEVVARENAYDAMQRRVTELYGRAVEQLGHDKAAVRLGGLYSLERVAQDYPEHRQTIVDVVCAYLRMSFHPQADTTSEVLNDSGEPGDAAESVQRNVTQEAQVRLAAERLLVRHLSGLMDDDSGSNSNKFSDLQWCNLRIDLRGAVLAEARFDGCHLLEANFSDVLFEGVASFVGAHFSGHVQFNNATFCEGARFEHARFDRDALFYNARFRRQFLWSADFYKAEFVGSVIFNDAEFDNGPRFSDARFNRFANFDRALFSGLDLSLTDMALVSGAQFDGAQFALRVTFDDARVFNADKHSWPQGWRVIPSLEISGGRLIHD